MTKTSPKDALFLISTSLFRENKFSLVFISDLLYLSADMATQLKEPSMRMCFAVHERHSVKLKMCVKFNLHCSTFSNELPLMLLCHGRSPEVRCWIHYYSHFISFL